MKKASRGSSTSEHIVDGSIAAWIFGGLAAGIAELALTGENLLDTGGAWQSWVAGGLVALLTFVVVVVWGRRNDPPTQ